MSSSRQVGAKSTRDETPPTLEEAATASVEAEEVLSAIMPLPQEALWMVMFENGTWIKRGLEIIQKVLNEIVVFTIDYVNHTIDKGDGSSVDQAYFFLTLSQELKDRNGTVFFQYPLHHAAISDSYIEEEMTRIERVKASGGPYDLEPVMPSFACLLSHLLGSLKNSTERLTTFPDAAQFNSDATSNQSKLVTLSIENNAEMSVQMINVKPISTNPFAKGPSKSKSPMTNMFPSVHMDTLFEEHSKSHAAVDRAVSSGRSSFISDMNLESFDFSWSVHNLVSQEMHHILTKTVVTKQAPREFSSSVVQGSMMDGDVVARFRLFHFEDAARGIPKTLVFNIQVYNESSKQLFDVRYPTQMMTVKPEEEELESRQMATNTNSDSLRDSLLRRVRFTRLESPMIDDEMLSRLKPSQSQTLFDEFYSARTLANFFSQGGHDTFTLYFGYKKGTAKSRDAVGILLIEVNRVAVDDRVAQLMILVRPLDTSVHSSLSRTQAAAANPNPFEK